MITVPKNETHVVIEFVDGDAKSVVYDQTLNKGDYELTLTLTSDTWGEKELYIYFNGEPNNNDRIVFTVEDA